jgi:hypothetical protein
MANEIDNSARCVQTGRVHPVGDPDPVCLESIDSLIEQLISLVIEKEECVNNHLFILLGYHFQL